jgi:Zn-dependent peptidase ImmA (M78 family)/transcriptional regulator with XRE-family HTH domain
MNIVVEGVTLSSLRSRYRADVASAAKLVGVEPNVFAEWEKNGAEVSITEAKKIAKAFHTHWSVFLLKKAVKPITEPVNHRAGYADSANFSNKTMRAYEVARKLLDTSEEIEGRTLIPQLETLARLGATGEDADIMAHKMRDLLGVTSAEIKTIRGGPYKVYDFWKKKISNLGIYVSEQDMPIEETKAFLMKDGDRAVIVINKKDGYIYSRVFSLVHELGHMIKGEASAACKVTISAKRSSREEAWCNKFASELLAYDDDVLRETVVDTLKSMKDPAPQLRRLANSYKVSFTVMLYKLVRHEKITDSQRKEMQLFFENVILPKIKSSNNKKEIRLGRAFYVGRDLSKASPSLAREVVEKQVQGLLSYSQAAKMLDTRARYYEDIKEAVGFGS